MQRLETKIFELREKLCESGDKNIKLKEENHQLSKTIDEVQAALEAERARPWWRNAGELAKVPLCALHYAAFLMLPALPHHFNKTTSASDFVNFK